MGIIIIKLFYRSKSILKLLIYKLLYLSKIKIGKRIVIYPRTHFIIEHNGKIIIGNNCFFNMDCSINSMSKITIGNNCIFGENVKIYDHNHNYKEDKILIKKQGYNYKEINIGNNCWIGSNVIILKGVTIGDNCVIGAGTVINKNIPNNTVVVQKKEYKFLEISK